MPTRIVLILAICMGLTCAGEAARLEAPPRDLFVVYDAASAAKPLTVTGDGGAISDIKPFAVSEAGRTALGIRLPARSATSYAALLIDAQTSAKTFGDPDFPVVAQEAWITCRASAGSQLVVRVGDGTRTYEHHAELTGEGWRDVRIGMPADMAGWRPLAAGAGAFDGRVRSLSVGIRIRNGVAGALELAQVALLPSPLDVRFTTDAPGNLFVTGDKPSGRISLEQAGAGVALRVSIEDAYGNSIRDLNGIAGRDTQIPLPDGFGYYTVRAKALGYRPGRSASYGVIPDNRVPGPEPENPFGVCCHWSDYWYKPEVGVIVKRIGIGSIRDGHHANTANPGGAYEAIKANGLTMFAFTAWTPKDEASVRRPDGSYRFDQFLATRAAYAKTVGAEVDNYDMCNEPVFGWSRVFGSPRWIDIFSGWFTPQYREAVQQADPGARIFWEGYPELAEQFIKAGGGAHIGGISPHPYAHKAEPEDHVLLNGGYMRLIEATRAAKLQWPVWIGEMGFTTFLGDSQHFKSVTEVQQAALLVRALTLHFAAGAEKIHYYDMVEWTAATWKGDPSRDDYNCEFRFGIIRKDFSPKPAAVSYANLIAQTKACRWLGRVRLPGGNDVHGYAFQRSGEKASMVVWKRRGSSTLPVPAGIQITDIFGKQTTWQGGDLTISEIPLYVHVQPTDIDPIPSYALLPRIYDATTARLGPGYGAARAPASPRKPNQTAAKKPTAPAMVMIAKPDALATWDQKLYERMLARVAQRKGPVFALGALRQQVSIEDVQGDELQLRLGIDGTFTSSWKRLSALDRLRLAQAMRTDGGDAQGDALVAFHAFAAGEYALGETHIARCGELAAVVRSGFDIPSAAADETATE